MTKLNVYSEPVLNSRPAPENDFNDAPVGIVALWRLLRSNKTMLLLPALLFAVLASLFSLRGEDSYTAEAQLILTRDNLDIIELDSSDRETVDAAIVTYAVNILNSRALAAKVVEELDLKSDPLINPYLGLDTIEEKPGLVRQFLYATGLRAPSGNEQSAVRDAEHDYLLTWLQETYVAGAIPNSNVVVVSTTTHDAALSAAISNAFIEGFLDFSLSASKQEADQAIDALSTRVQSLRLQVQTDQTALQDAQASIDVISQEALQSLSSELADLKSRETEIREDINSLSAALDVLSELTERAPDVITQALNTDPRLRAFTKQVLRREPTVETAQNDLTILRNELRSQRISREQRSSALQSSLARLEQRLQRSNEDTINLSRLEVELETTTSVYASALGRLKELVMESGLRNEGGRFLVRAVPPVKADSKGRRRFVAIATFLGLLIGATGVLIREAANERIRSLTDLSNSSGSFARVEIPRLRSWLRFGGASRNDKFLVGGSSGFSEAVRICRRLMLEQFDAGAPQVINVMSPLPREGKSTLCGALASSFVLVGKRTLVIDADLRGRGLTQEVFAKPPATGLQQAVLGYPNDWAKQIVEAPELGFHCIPAGQDMHNPADLLEMTQFRNLIRDLKEHYDIILIDTPPILMFPEARAVAEVSTHSVMVAGYNQTPKSALREVFTLLPSNVTSGLTIALCKTPGTAATRFGAAQNNSAY